MIVLRLAISPMILWIALSVCCRGQFAFVEANASEIWQPRNVPKNTCAPICLLTTLKYGSPNLRSVYEGISGSDEHAKLQSILSIYGKRDSTVTKGLKRFGVVNGGMMYEDIYASYAEMREEFGGPLLNSIWADRRSNETRTEHLHRIHSYLSCSLARGNPVIAGITSYVAQKREEKTILWHGIISHAIVIVKVPASIATDRKSFAFDYIDAEKGVVDEGFACLEETRPFFATKGSDSEKFDWIPDSPYLVLTSPSLPMGTSEAKWNERTVITINHLIGDFDKTEP